MLQERLLDIIVLNLKNKLFLVIYFFLEFGIYIKFHKLLIILFTLSFKYDEARKYFVLQITLTFLDLIIS